MGRIILEETRVKRGEPYWFVDISGKAWDRYERNEVMDSILFGIGNYFHTRKEALQMARKLRAVLNGADVIEMPSDINERQVRLNDYGSERERYAFDYGFERAVEIFKSKIVK